MESWNVGQTMVVRRARYAKTKICTVPKTIPHRFGMNTFGFQMASPKSAQGREHMSVETPRESGRNSVLWAASASWMPAMGPAYIMMLMIKQAVPEIACIFSAFASAYALYALTATRGTEDCIAIDAFSAR